MYRFPSLPSSLLGILFLLCSVTPLWAATYTVDRFDDVSPTDATIQPPITDCDDAVPNDCTLRGAILKANAAAGADIIQIPAGTYTVVGGGQDEVGFIGDLDVHGAVTITGAGADVTIIDGGGTDRILDICALDSPNRCPVPPVVAIAGITFQNTGSGTSAGGVRNRLGTLTVTNSTFRNCRAIAVDNDRGTLTLSNVLIEEASNNGIRNDGTLTIVGSTIRNLGAGLFNSKQGPSAGLAIVRDSTFTGNGFTAFAGGAGIDNRNGGTLVLINTTLSGNRGGALYNNEATAHLFNVTITNSISTAGGIHNVTATGTVTLRHSIVAGNRNSGGTPVDCQGILTSQGYNLIEIPASTCTITGDVTGNLVGVAANLGPLADNGGPTLTHVPFVGSPVLDAGNPAGCTADDDNNPTTPDVLLTTDQRGFVRPFDGNNDNDARCDIGAVEGFAELFDGDNDGFSITEGDCNDTDPTINPSAPERCNTVDDNCNGTVDEGFSLGGACTAGVGLCQQTGVLICTADGQGTQCSVIGGTGSPEVCNSLDDNCDGEVDAITLQPLTQVCYSGPAGTAGVGICQEGEQTCLSGAFGNCANEILPVTEVCNGLDDDCNATVDDNLSDPTLGQACATGQLGVCSAGTIACTAGSLSCILNTPPTTEVCDGLDNNCNGTSDEGLTTDSDSDGFTTPGSCSGTKNDCNDSNPTVYPGAPEICGDGLDNDCNGIVDLSIPEVKRRPGDRQLGTWVAVDGETALVSTLFADDGDTVYVLRRSGVIWTQEAALTVSGETGNTLVNSIALDGNTALIAGGGTVSVFVRTTTGAGTTWTQQAQLTPADGGSGGFGFAVALHGDTALIGDIGGAAYVFVRTGATWSQQAKLTASDGAADDFFGGRVGLDGDTALIGAWGDDDQGNSSGSAYVFVRTGTTWSQQAKLTASDGAVNNLFGASVALEGDTVLIGSQNSGNQGGGAAYVFARTNTTWTQQAKLTANDGTLGNAFGQSVALDADTALIGAARDDEQGNQAGAAYVFVRTGTSWSQQTKIMASDGGRGDNFGTGVALADTLAVIGAPGADAVYPYVRSGDTWSEQVKRRPGDRQLGTWVAVDGETALVSTLFADDGDTVYVLRRNGVIWTQEAALTVSGETGNTLVNSIALDGNTALIGGVGTVSVFVRTGTGASTTWTQQVQFTPADGGSGGFGFAVALHGDTALIGDIGGATYVFVRTGTTWSQQAKLTASDGAGNDFFGGRVALDSDTALIGAWGDDDQGNSSGSAYVFVRTGTTWSQQAKLTASDGAANNRFGASVALEGDTVLIGAQNSGNQGGEAVYVFARTNTTWTQQAKLTANDGTLGNAFGESVALEGDTALIGAARDDEQGNQAGAAYVFVRTGTSWSQQTKIMANDGGRGDHFGTGVALADTLAVIGAPGADAVYFYQLPRELCDGRDNNCNGVADEGFNVGGVCTVGIGACQNTGDLICAADGSGTQCTATPGTPSPEICGDGIDQDCNGQDLLCPDNTPPGSAVVVRPVDTTTTTTPVTLTFSQVTRSGTTSLTTSSTGPPPPSGFALGKPPVYYDLTTTAAFSGLVEVCINYSGVRFKNEATLKLQHFEGGRWVNRTISLDTVHDIICARVSSLSPFAIFESTSVPFATFAAKLEIKKDVFEMKAAFTLDTTSDGINPLTEEVRLAVGTFATTIPAGSFKFKPAIPGKNGKPGKPAEFVFEGVANRVHLEIKITALATKRFEFKVEGKGTDLRRVTNPVTVNLVIGDDSGTTTTRADRDEGPRQ